MKFRQRDPHLTLRSVPGLLLGVLLLFSFTGTALSQQTGMLRGVTDEIPADATKIVLQEETVFPGDAYINALRYFQRKDFVVTSSEETFNTSILKDLIDNEPLIFEVKKQISDDMALSISVNIDSRRPRGSIIKADAKWAHDVAAGSDEWKQAKWTSGRDRIAFFKALELMRGTAYDTITFEIGVVPAS